MYEYNRTIAYMHVCKSIYYLCPQPSLFPLYFCEVYIHATLQSEVVIVRHITLFELWIQTSNIPSSFLHIVFFFFY